MRTKEWLIDQRTKHILTQRQLANQIGVSVYAIENIEQGKRLGSAETWDKIEKFFNSGEDVKISYDSNDLINELKNDIAEFGEEHKCILIYKVLDNGYIVFTNYDFVVEEEPFNEEKELEEGEKYIITTLKYALEVFESQNNII